MFIKKIFCCVIIKLGGGVRNNKYKYTINTNNFVLIIFPVIISYNFSVLIHFGYICNYHGDEIFVLFYYPQILIKNFNHIWTVIMLILWNVRLGHSLVQDFYWKTFLKFIKASPTHTLKLVNLFPHKIPKGLHNFSIIHGKSVTSFKCQ